MVSLCLDFLSQGNPEEGARLLLENYPKNLFRTGLGLIHQLRLRVLHSIEVARLPHMESIRNNFSSMKTGNVLEILDGYAETVLTHEQTEILKGLFNRFPLRPDRHTTYRDEEAVRLSFSPVRSVKDLQVLVQAIESITALIRLTDLSPVQSPGLPVATALNRGLARALLRNTFSSVPLTSEEALLFLQADDTTLQEGKEQFLKAAGLRLGKETPWLRHKSGTKEPEAVDAFLSWSAFPGSASEEVAALCNNLITSRSSGGFFRLTDSEDISQPVRKDAPSSDISEARFP